MQRKLAAVAGMAALFATLTLFVLAQGALANHSITDLVSTGPSGGNGPFDASQPRISADGSTEIFVTSEQLVPADTDNQPDVYARRNGTTTLISIGPTGGNGAFPAYPPEQSEMSADGSHILFVTRERLTSDDTDNNLDVYELFNGQTTLVSTGPAGGNGPYDVYSPNFLISRDGSRVTFITGERLTSDDTNNLYDAYQWSGGVTTLLTGGKITRGDGSMRLIGASQDGRRVFIETGLQLLSSDQDGEADVYEWADGTLTLETVDANGQNSIFPIVTLFEYINADGTHLFFSTAARLTSDDTNNDFDIYERTGGVTRLVSTGPNGNNTPCTSFDCSYSAFAGVSADGSRVFFETGRQLVPGDTDNQFDAYVRINGTTTELVSAGPVGNTPDPAGFQLGMASSADGSRAFFLTSGALTSDDTDNTTSIYERSNGTTKYIGSTADGFVGLSADGSRVFVLSRDPLVPSDTDGGCNDFFENHPGCADFYEYHSGQATLISTGPGSLNGPFSVCESFQTSEGQGYGDCPFAQSEDGTHVLFRTNERLVSTDTDSSFDIYSSSVASGPKRSDFRNASSFCNAERDFLGDDAFRKRYGTNGNGANAFGKCVSSN